MVERRDYYPFGGRIEATVANARTCAVPANCPNLAGYSAEVGVAHLFTGKERDAETGLDYFETRYFSSAQGRFTSPDEPLMDQDVNDPQSWDLYGYVRNNPLRFTDPTGQACVSDGNGGVTVIRSNPDDYTEAAKTEL